MKRVGPKAWMLSIDANIIIYSLNKTMSEHERARSFLVQLSDRNDVVIAEQILVEVYLLIRNPAVFPNLFTRSRASL